MATKPQQIFEYLLAVKNLTQPPVRDFRQLEESAYVNDLPRGEGCYLFGEGEATEAWLEVHKQQIPSPPEPDPLFKDWLKTDHYKAHVLPEVTPSKEVLPSLHFGKDDPPFREEKFEDRPERVEAFHQWLVRWKNWAEVARHKSAVQELYNRLFTLVNRLEREGETLELAFGHGLLTWDHPDGRIHHPLLTTRMELDFHPRKSRFTLTPTQRGTVLETEMLTGVKLPQGAHLPRLRSWVEEKQLHPLDREDAIPFYKELAQTLHPEGEFIAGDGRIKFKKTPVILEKPVWFLRKRATQLWKDELRTTIEALGQGMQAPKTIRSLLQMESIQPEKQEQQSWSSVGEDLWFPLPANEEQKEIARRLSKNFGVTVQGPPGTGKSHTIANLISHLLAHGKKVLVTSHKEPALRVLAEKIPEEIRSLCVSVLGRDSKSLQEIEDSIRSISNQMSEQDPERLGREVNNLKEQLKNNRKRIAQYKMQLKQMASQNMEPIRWKNQSLSPMDAAKELTETEQEHGWIPDRVTADPPLTDSELRKLWSLTGELSPDTRSLLDQIFPNPDSLPNAAAFKIQLTEGAQRKEQAAKSRDLLQRYQLPDSEGERRELLDLLQPILKDERWFQSLYAQNILSDLLAGGKREELWTSLVQSMEDALESITDLQNRLAEYDINLPEIPRHQLQQDTQTLIQRLRAGKSIWGLYLVFSGRKLRYLVEHPAVDGRPVQTEEDAQLMMEQLKLEDQQNRLVKRWNTLLQEMEGPSLNPSESRLVARADELLSHLKIIVSIKDRIRNLQEKTTSLTLPEEFCWYAPPSFHELREACQAVDDQLRQEQWETEYQKQTRYLHKLTLDSKAHPICNQLLEAWQQKEASLWEVAQNELLRLQELRGKHLQLRDLSNRLQEAAPVWNARILSQMGTPSPFPDRWLEAWEWKRAHTEVEKVNSLQPENIQQKLKEQQEQERRLLESIVAKSAWREQLLRITEPQKRALVTWKQIIKKIGKGTGKYATKHRQDARVEMEKCQPAIPVWIMPIERVIENLDLRNNKFDVVIVDESSQCDLFALSALMRADRAVVVGDDQQISPSAVGTDQEAVHSLIVRHLKGVPQANSLDTQTSLYDVATRIFPGVLTLKEHFRCVPEIIQFSNDLSYGGEIIPLRLPKQKDRLEPAVLARRVPGYRDEMKQINEPEAEAIVADIQAMLKDSAYDNRTIGVISLLGNDQAQLIEKRLRETIGEEQMLKRKIICGDAYAFQGDERDVICLSLVIADNVRFGALVRKDAQQRFNVAASRAKNQMRLYHSVDLEDLNPDDLRYRLLNYCQNPRRVMEKVENAESLCESQFEKDVLRMIIARGYQVRPQVKVGRYRIDLVVEGLTNRLAVECDGDQWHGPDRWEEDMLRQQTLERAGWRLLPQSQPSDGHPVDEAGRDEDRTGEGAKHGIIKRHP